MKTTVSICLLALAALTAVSPAVAQSTLPKEGGVAFSAIFHSIGHEVSMGEDLSHFLLASGQHLFRSCRCRQG
jgi:hypothetical protein